MKRSRRMNIFLSLILFSITFFALSAVSAYAAGSVKITRPANNSTVPKGAVSVWVSVDALPGSVSDAVRDFTPVTFRIFKGGVLQLEQPVNPGRLSVESEGAYCTSFNFSETGTYTIMASVPKTQGQWDSVTINVSDSSGSSGESDEADFSDESVNSENAAALSEGAASRCRLTKAGNYTAAYKLTPQQSGYHIFFGAGSRKKVKGELYEGAGDTAFLDYVEGETGDEGCFCFMADLEAGTTYTYVIRSTLEEDDNIFDVGYVSKSSGKSVASANEITLTSADNKYTFGIFSWSQLEGIDWVSSDKSIVGITDDVSFSHGLPISSKFYNYSAAHFETKKNGTATVSIVNGYTGEVYASCKVTCVGFVESKGGQTGGKSGSQAGTQSGATGSGTAKSEAGGKKAVKLTAKNKSFKASTKTKKYTVTLKNQSGKAIKNVRLTLKVKGKTYKALTNAKGKATFKITKLKKKGKYTALIKFAGNKTYKAASKKVKITVKK